MADNGVPTTSELKKFKVVELKAKLQEFGLPVNGLKAELIERLQEFYSQQNKPKHVQETTLPYSETQQVSPMQSPEIRQVLPVQSPEIRQVLPVQSPEICQVLPPQSPEVHKVLPAQSPDAHKVLPVQSPVAPQVFPKQSPGEQHVSLSQSPGAHQASPVQFIAAKPVSPIAPQVTPMHASSLQPIIIPGNNPVLVQSPNVQPKSPLKSPGVTRQVSPQKSPVLQSKIVLDPVVGSQPVQLPEKVLDEQPVRISTPQNISVSGGQSKVEVTKGALSAVNIPQPITHSGKASELSLGNKVTVSSEGQAKIEARHDKSEVPKEQTRKPVAELQSSTALDEEKMSTNQGGNSTAENRVTALHDDSTSQKTSVQEEVQPVVKEEREKQVVFPKKQMGEFKSESLQMREKAKSIHLEQRQMPPRYPERPTVSLPVQVSQPVPRSQFSHQKQVDVEMRGQSAVGLKSQPPQIVPVREPSTEDSGIDMSESPSEEMSHGGHQKAVAMEKTETKGKKKKKKKKKRRQRQVAVQGDEYMYEEDEVEVEYVPEQFDASDPNYRAFAKIFEAFKLSDEAVKEKEKVAEKKEEFVEAKKTEVVVMKDSDDEDDEEDKPKEDDKPKISKKKLRKMNRLSVAELKQLVPRPDVVEMHDVTAQDPKLLVFLKSCRNTVPVPRHWCFKRKYLQGKRGIIKSPFELPEFIKKTGIMEMREAMQEKEEQKTLKAKMREKVRPKMGKINIDYQKLHDAFFKWQTKPKMTIHGDLYYEGKEFETKLKEKKPGDLSEELRTALGMPTGSGSHLVPPPWLIAMQRYGPPPSYPNLKIPGLNAAIPEGAAFGYHAGGWGKPPVDETGRPLYGDVFGTQQTEVTVVEVDDQVDKAPWGELESEEESEESSEEESEEEEDQTGLVTPADTGLVTPSGLTSIPAGMETPDMIELRKRKTIEDAMETGAEQPSLYTVLPEKRAAVGGAMMGSAHVYDINATVQPGIRKVGAGEGIEVALDPSELELDPLAMQARYEEQMKERESQLQKEDLSDMVAEHAAKQQKKRKKATDSGKAAKKYKEFKF